ncbi:CobW/HypB/UreG, nucleotide-binding domain-containing protein [Usnea florida]
MPPIPITIVTGFLGSGKTTLILNLIPQLPKTYKLALLKNEFGDVAVDSKLASSSAIGGVQELLNGCICCNLVGQLGEALDTLRKDVDPDRIIIETSGSAFPATLAMEVNRLARETRYYTLDGVVVVIDVENWKGYEDTSYTAKMQARYTDLIVFNKWELVPERRYEDCLDRVGDLELQVATVKSDKGRVDQSVLLGLDSAFAKELDPLSDRHQNHEHLTDHQSEVEVLSVTVSSEDTMTHGINLESLETFLLSAPKDEIYRIKAIVKASRPPASSGGDVDPAVVHQGQTSAKYILNWAFGRWTSSSNGSIVEIPEGLEIDPLVRMTVILARGEADKWKKRIETQGNFETDNESGKARLQVTKIAL